MEYPNFKKYGPPACTNVSDRDIFFPETGDTNREQKVKEAKKACAGCPYLTACFEYAISNPEEQGIWGGTTEFERRRMRRRAYEGKLIKV